MARDKIDLVSVWEAIIDELRVQLQLNSDQCFFMLPDARGAHFTPTAPTDTFITISPDGGSFDVGLIQGGGVEQITVETGFVVTIHKTWNLDEAGHDQKFLNSDKGIGELMTAVVLALTGFDPTFGQYSSPKLRELIRPTGFERPWRDESENRGGVSIHFDMSFDIGLGDYPDLTTTTTTSTTTTTPAPPSIASLDIIASADAHIVSSGSNDGESEQLIIGTTALFGNSFKYRGLLRFNLAPLANKQIISVSLTLHANGNAQLFTPMTITLFRCTRLDWNETQCTWSNYDVVHPWTFSGGDFDGATGIAAVVTDNDQDLLYNGQDFTNLVTGVFADGFTYANTLSLLLIGQESPTNTFYTAHSREAASEADRPTLHVTYYDL